MKHKGRKAKYKGTIMTMLKLFILALYTGIFAYIWLFYYNNKEIAWGFHTKGNWLLFLIYLLLVYVISKVYNPFNVGHMKPSDTIYSNFLMMVGVDVIAYFIVSLIAREMLNVLPFLIMLGIDIVAAIVWSLIANAIFVKLFPPHNMIMVYGSRLVESISEKMQSRTDRYNITKYVDIHNGVEEICKIIPQFDSVVVCDVDATARNEIVKFCFEISKRCYIVPKLSDILIRGSNEIHMFDSPIFLLKNEALNFGHKLIKRMMDLLMVIPLCIIAAPFMAVIALAIKLQDGGPVFYKQKRLTLDNKVFEVLKFRSMIPDAEKVGGAQLAKEGDSRITPIGKIIRKIRMDELPQLFNILKGDMSFVGPRPERPEIAEKYMEEMPEFKYRTKVKAGLTGFAQVLGKYNTTPYDKLKLDLMYISKYSALLDIKLILMTIKILFVSESTEGFTEKNSIPKSKSENNNGEEK